MRGRSVIEKEHERGWSLVESVSPPDTSPSAYLGRRTGQNFGDGRTVMNGSPIGLHPDPARAGPEGWVPSLALMPAGFIKGELDLLSLYLTRRLWELSGQHDSVTYLLGGKDIKEGHIDCSGWVNYANKAIYDELDGGSRRMFPEEFAKLFRNGAAWQIEDWDKTVGGLTTGADLSPETMQPGVLIGLNYYNRNNGRFKRIDHIVQVLFDPKTHDAYITQSSESGSGVNVKKLSDWFAGMDEKIGRDRLFAVDPYMHARVDVDAYIAKFAIR
jgi:hypothetical protein